MDNQPLSRRRVVSSSLLDQLLADIRRTLRPIRFERILTPAANQPTTTESTVVRTQNPR